MIFDADFHKVKLIDFGMTRKCGSYVRRLIGSIPYSPPEVCNAPSNDILVSTAMDIWAFGVLLFCCLTGKISSKSIRISSHSNRSFFLKVISHGSMLKNQMSIIMNIYNGIDVINYNVVVRYPPSGIDLPVVL